MTLPWLYASVRQTGPGPILGPNRQGTIKLSVARVSFLEQCNFLPNDVVFVPRFLAAEWLTHAISRWCEMYMEFVPRTFLYSSFQTEEVQIQAKSMY